MKTITQRLLGLTLLLVFSHTTLADEGWWLGLGKGMSDVLIQSQNISNVNLLQAGLRFDTDYRIEQGLFEGGELEVESYLGLLDGEQNLAVLGLRPVFNFYPETKPGRPLSLIWQLGLGLSLFSDKHLEAIELSTHAQFAIVAGVGIWLDKNKQHRLMLRYNHYSNGYLKSPNQGLDYLSLDWQVNW